MTTSKGDDEDCILQTAPPRYATPCRYWDDACRLQMMRARAREAGKQKPQWKRDAITSTD